MENKVMKKTKTEKVLEILEKPAVRMGLTCLALVAVNQGLFAADTPVVEDPVMSGAADGLARVLFSPWLKKVILAFGGIGGVIQSVLGGSFKPLLVWGGLGLSFTFIPKMITFISTM